MIELQLQNWKTPVFAVGDASITEHQMVGFFCSRKYPAKAVLRIYDWAKQASADGQCVISGFHSPLERDVLDILLDGKQPVALVLARGISKRITTRFESQLKSRRLLVLSPFPPTITRPIAGTAYKRCQFVESLSDSLVVGAASPTSQLSALIAATTKPVLRLDT